MRKFRFFKAFNKISRKDFTPTTSLKNMLIATVILLAVTSGIIYYFTKDIGYLVAAIIVSVWLMGKGIYSYFKQKKDDSKATEHHKILQNNSKFKNSKWREEFYNYKASHTFETIDEKGMKYDLKKRYKTKENFLLVKLGSVFILFSIFLIVYQSTLSNISIGIFGIILGIICVVRGIAILTAKPVKEFYHRNYDFKALEKSYRKGKILSYKDNGINLGTTHIIVYNLKNIYAIDYQNVYGVVKKIVRVKNYENGVVYANDEYRYYIEITAKTSSEAHTKIDVEFDEYQCEMVMNEYRKTHYSPVQKNIIEQKNSNALSV